MKDKSLVHDHLAGRFDALMNEHEMSRRLRSCWCTIVAAGRRRLYPCTIAYPVLKIRSLLKRRCPLDPRILLIALLVVSLSAHAALLITDGFGESDAARVANDCIKAVYSGGFHNLEYTVYSSPLYDDVLRFVFSIGAISISGFPRWMALASLVSSAIVTVALFMFVFRLTTSVLPAFGAALILQLMPVFWFNSVYGFAPIVALAFFTSSLVLFQNALARRSSKQRSMLLAAAAILYGLAVFTKVDISLASAAYGLPVWRSDRSLRTRVIWIALLAAFSALVYLLFHQYAESLERTPQVAAFDLGRFNSRWPLQFQNFFSWRNFKITTKAVGAVSIPTAAAGWLLIGWRQRWRSTLFWIAASAIPIVLFWGMRPANSARHNLIPGLFLCVVLALPLAMPAWRKWAWAGVLGVILLINYSCYPPAASTTSPSGRLLASTRLLGEKAQHLHQAGKTIAQLPHAAVAVIGQGWDHSYFRFEVLRNSQLSYVGHTATEAVQTMEMQSGDEKRSFLWLNRQLDTSEIVALAEEGYFLVVYDGEIAQELEHVTGLQGKWMALDD